jgi:hypothetical protein
MGSAKRAGKAAASIAGFVINNWQWCATTGVGLIMALLAWLTGTLQIYAPFSYGAAFLIAALSAAIIFAAAAWAKERFAKSLYWNHVTQPSTNVNPLDTSFSGMRISLEQIANPETRVIEGKTFVGCEVVGRRLSFLYYSCHYNGYLGWAACDLISLPLTKGMKVPNYNNLFIVRNCIFKDCKFFYQTMLFSDHDAADMVEKLQNGTPRDWVIIPPKTVNE